MTKLSLLHPYGSNIWQPPKKGCERIAFQNARGINRTTQPASNVFAAAKEYTVGIYGVAEPNCAFTDTRLEAINAGSQREMGKGFVIGASIPNNKLHYLLGGIMQLVSGDSVG